jgi:hypothetical protein
MWQKFASHPQHHEAVIAALAGTLSGGKPQLHGLTPTKDCNPWLRQMWNDICFAATLDPALNAQILQVGWRHLHHSSAFLQFRHRLLPFFSSPADLHLHLDESHDHVCFCGHLCHGNQGLAMHKYWKHATQPYIFRFVLGNRCPLCKQIFSTVRSTRLHLFRRFP